MKSAARARPAPVMVYPRRPGQMWKLFAAAVFLAFALPLAMLAGFLGWHQHRILTAWPLVDALVAKAEVVQNTGSTYSVRFGLRYAAQGRVYDSSVAIGSAPSRAAAGRWLEQMAVGSRVRLRYDPRDPTNISLVADSTPRSYAAPGMLAKWAAVMAAISLILLGLGWWAGKGRGPGGGSQEPAKTGA